MSEEAGRDRRPVWSSGYGGRDSRHKTQNGLATAPKKRHEQICPTGRCWSLRYISPLHSCDSSGKRESSTAPLRLRGLPQIRVFCSCVARLTAAHRTPRSTVVRSCADIVQGAQTRRVAMLVAGSVVPACAGIRDCRRGGYRYSPSHPCVCRARKMLPRGPGRPYGGHPCVCGDRTGWLQSKPFRALDRCALLGGGPSTTQERQV